MMNQDHRLEVFVVFGAVLRFDTRWVILDHQCITLIDSYQQLLDLHGIGIKSLFRLRCNSFLLHRWIYRRHFDTKFTISAIDGIIEFRASTNVSICALGDFIRWIFEDCSTTFASTMFHQGLIVTNNLGHSYLPFLFLFRIRALAAALRACECRPPPFHNLE